MNVKTILDNINLTIRKLKNSQWRLETSKGKELLGTENLVTQYPFFENLRKTKLNEISEALSLIPNYRKLGTKSPSVISEKQSFQVAVYYSNDIFSVQATEEISKEDISLAIIDSENNLIDARIQGGGLSKQFIEMSMAGNPRLNSYADIGRYDGTPTNASAAFLIELPKDILSKYSESVILSAINKYKAGGSYPVLAYYDSSSSESLGWNLQGSEDK